MSAQGNPGVVGKRGCWCGLGRSVCHAGASMPSFPARAQFDDYSWVPAWLLVIEPATRCCRGNRADIAKVLKHVGAIGTQWPSKRSEIIGLASCRGGIRPLLTCESTSGGSQVASIAAMPLSMICCRKNDCLRPVTSASSRNLLCSIWGARVPQPPACLISRFLTRLSRRFRQLSVLSTSSR